MARKANGAGTAAPPPLKWNTTKLTSSYANFCNANSTREEVVLNFGVNKNWERGVGTGGVEIDLNHRIVLSPFAAKRLTHGTPAAAHEGVRGALRGARRVGIRSRPCAIAFAVACLSGCGTKSADLNAFLGPPPGTVYVYKRIGEIHQRVTYVEGISTPGPASVLVRMQTRDATDRPEQVRVLGAATQSEFAVQGGALVERHLGRIVLKVPSRGTVSWKDTVDNVPGPPEAPRFHCSATAPVSKEILGKERLTVEATCELDVGKGTTLREVTLYAAGIGMAAQTESVIDSAAPPGGQVPLHLELIAMQAVK